MYFDFYDSRPDITPVGQAISWREGVLLSIIGHLVAVVLLLMAPRWFPDDLAARARALEAAQQTPREQTQFVFVQPRIERPAPRAPDRAELSDIDRLARAPERSERPINPLPFARGNSPERVEEAPRQSARGQGPQPDPAAGRPAPNTAPDNRLEAPESLSSPQMPAARQPGAAKRRA